MVQSACERLPRLVCSCTVGDEGPDGREPICCTRQSLAVVAFQLTPLISRGFWSVENKSRLAVVTKKWRVRRKMPGRVNKTDTFPEGAEGGAQPREGASVHARQHLADWPRHPCQSWGPAALCGVQATRRGPPGMGAAA